ncbi:hypothetical protein [Carboxylicivirga sp. N1Y90]|uniref:hypothetical protein n=1 Tax=Carboxylicivirga fragile TaxID=3417571 RepID=UPI003D3492D3
MTKKPTIYYNSFQHGQTPLVKLFFYDNDSIEQCIRSLNYVRYSQQYQCYYIRDDNNFKTLLQEDIKAVANISTKYLNAASFNNKKKSSDLKAKDALNAFEQTALVAITIVNNKAYLKLPYLFKQRWTSYGKKWEVYLKPKDAFGLYPITLTIKKPFSNILKNKDVK